MISALVIALLIPIILIIFLIRDRKTKLLLSFFAWGSIAGLLAHYFNNWAVEMVNIEFKKFAIEYAPLIEEFFKALPFL